MPQIERFYSFQLLGDSASCVDIAKEFTKVIDNRCPALWRGGDNQTSVSLSDKGWHDFGTGESGGVVELVAKFMGTNTQEAQQWLGDKLMLEPTMRLGREPKGTMNRAERLKADNYSLVKTYSYTDEDGIEIHAVERWEHAKKKKEFCQRTADGKYSVKGIKTYLYRLHEWIGENYVAICEGEKDADTVKDVLGYHATTNASGAGRWENHYTEWLKGKKIIIFSDNDDPGRKRSNFLLWTLKDVANDIKLITFDGEAEGFDISDYVAKHGVDAAKNLIKSTPIVEKDKILRPTEDYPAILAAKEKNKFDLCNYFTFQKDGDNGKKVAEFKPRQINDLITDINTRFIGFPCRISDRLFDHDRETGKIEYLDSPSELFAWMERKSNRLIQWKRGDGYVSKEEIFCGVKGAARCFEGVSSTPDYPPRSNIYYSHPAIPTPSTNYDYLNKLVSFFCPASDEYRTLLKAFFAAPLYYIDGIPRPCWIIDSEDGAGTGKTTMVETCAFLYGQEAIRGNINELKRNMAEITKRVVSTAGRSRRIFLLDNVTGEFSSPEFADMITSRSISGKAPYGRGEESRPNNLTYVITANSATVDNDLSDRSYHIFVKKQEITAKWKTDLDEFISKNRYQIMADIIGCIENNSNMGVPPVTRFPEFETAILQAFCCDQEEYERVIKTVLGAKRESNIEEEHAEAVREMLRVELMEIYGIYPETDCVFIRSQALEEMLKRHKLHLSHQQIRNFAKNNMMPEIDSKIKIYPHHGTGRRRGIMWNYDHKKEGVKTVGLGRDGKLSNIACV